MPMPSRHFPPPWDIDDNGSCFIARDHNGQALAYIYYEVDPGRRTAAKTDVLWRAQIGPCRHRGPHDCILLPRLHFWRFRIGCDRYAHCKPQIASANVNVNICRADI
jgi:hypothetical protein